MINYTEKHGIHEAIKAAGFRLRQLNGVHTSADDNGEDNHDAEVQAILDAYTLADAAAFASDLIDDNAKRLRDKLSKRVSASEMASWPIKKMEADKFTATGQASDAPALAAEATERGSSLANLVTKVLNNFAAASNREAKISGVAGKHKDAVKACATHAAITAYVQGSIEKLSGWPAG